ncbi:MAG TPA: hypothetical protein VH333_05870 [Pseudonocardiaceae bacterium]|jgi:hypothetical protein|nr:hypothetical protein [Pseudonocardiaceae bacterium]
MTVLRRIIAGALATAALLVTLVGTASAAQNSCHDGGGGQVTFAAPADGCPGVH